ncbi:MAG: PDZ domain-containing protein [Planctomycetota bacterium]|nr:MAG: PDZ domain-containing protein [Planctomycetota bacterium]
MQRRVFASSISIAALAICVLATCVNAQVPAGPPGAKPLGVPAQGPGFGQALPRKLDAVGGIVIGGPVATPPLPTDVELNAVAIDAWLEALVSELSSNSFETRVAASAMLLEKRADQRQLMSLLARTNIDREARARLIFALQQRILKAPRGALGVRMESMRDDLGVRVTGLIPGMPGEKLLRLHDVVYAIDGAPLALREDLIRNVQSKEPGRVVTLSVYRQQRDAKGKGLFDANGQPLLDKHDFEIELASTDTLEVKGGPEQVNLLPSPISLEREALAEAVATRFGETARVLTLPEREVEARKGQALDAHPVVREALASLELLRKVGGADAATMKLLLIEATKLRQKAESDGISDAEREHLLALADRVDAIVLEISRLGK